jgi:hypothetical protein
MCVWYLPVQHRCILGSSENTEAPGSKQKTAANPHQHQQLALHTITATRHQQHLKLPKFVTQQLRLAVIVACQLSHLLKLPCAKRHLSSHQRPRLLLGYQMRLRLAASNLFILTPCAFCKSLSHYAASDRQPTQHTTTYFHRCAAASLPKAMHGWMRTLVPPPRC